MRAKISALGTYVLPLASNLIPIWKKWSKPRMIGLFEPVGIRERHIVEKGVLDWTIWRQPPPNAHWSSVASVPTNAKRLLWARATPA